MISEEDPFVGKLRSADAVFDDVIRLNGIVHLHFEVSLHCAGEAVRNRQSTLPIFWRGWAVHVFEQRLRVVPREWQCDKVRERASFILRNALCARHRSPTRSKWIARNDKVVSNSAALNVGFWTPRTVGKDFAFYVAVFCGIGIDEQRGGAVLFGS